MYIFIQKMDNAMPQIMQMLMSSAIVENACGVISAADNAHSPAPLLPAPPGSHNAVHRSRTIEATARGVPDLPTER